jgi:uncharacterized protein (DUF58 family)
MPGPTEKTVTANSETLARLSRLELRARTVVEGVLSGMHKSPHRGSSVEFAQHRDYVQGDEIRHIDWKVYSRTDRYHIKQFEEETNLKAMLVLDVSASMDYKGAESRESKREYGGVIAAAMASLLLRQRDAVGLATFDSGVRQFLPPSGTPGHLRLVMELLAQTPTGPKTGLGETFHDLAERVKRRGLLIIISDLFGDPEETLRGLQHFRHRRHDVIVLHVLDRDELTFPFRETSLFEGMEGESPIMAEPNSLRREYLNAFNVFLDRLKDGCRDSGVDYHLMPTDEPLEIALPRYLARRMHRD